MAKDSKTIGVTVRFWTDDIAPGKGRISPGNAWASGTINVQANNAHHIKAGEPILFKGMADLLVKLEEALVASGVTLKLDSHERKLFTT